MDDYEWDDMKPCQEGNTTHGSEIGLEECDSGNTFTHMDNMDDYEWDDMKPCQEGNTTHWSEIDLDFSQFRPHNITAETELALGQAPEDHGDQTHQTLPQVLKYVRMARSNLRKQQHYFQQSKRYMRKEILRLAEENYELRSQNKRSHVDTCDLKMIVMEQKSAMKNLEENLRLQKEASDAEITQLKNNMAETQQWNSHLRMDVFDLQATQEHCKLHHSSSSELQEMEKCLEQHKTTILSLEEKLIIQLDKNEACQAAITYLTSTNDNLQDTQIVLQDETAHLKEELEEQLKMQMEKNTTCEAEITYLKSSNNDLQEIKILLENKIVYLKEDMEKLKIQLVKISATQNELPEALSTIETLSVQTEALLVELQELEEAKGSLTEQSHTLKKTVEDLEEKLIIQNKKNKAYAAKLTELRFVNRQLEKLPAWIEKFKVREPQRYVYYYEYK